MNKKNNTMQAIEFETMIGEKNIPIPIQYNFLSNKMAKINVIYYDDVNTSSTIQYDIKKQAKQGKYSVMDFINEYSGFLSGIECDDDKYNRIMEKHI